MANAFLTLLDEYRFPGDQPWVRPAYEGMSIINLMSSLLAHFDIRYGTPLHFHDELAAKLAGKRKVVFLFIDGLGWMNIEQAALQSPMIRDVFATATRWPITTVSPSTTSTASASYLTALPPAEHGVLGFLMYFPEYDRVFNMLNFNAAVSRTENLMDFGFHPEGYIGHPTILQILEKAGIMIGAFTYYQIAGSGLSRLLYCAHQPHPYVALGDLFWMLQQQLSTPVPQFHFLYWSSLDTIGHAYGARSGAYAIELSMVAAVLRDQILPSLDSETAFIISADHGHIDGNDDEAINLANIPGLIDLFRVPPAGEGRETQLFIHPGEVAHARDLLEQAGNMLVMTKNEFLDSKLLGNPPLRPDLLDRLGDLIIFPHGSRRTLYQYEPRPHTSMVGRHGGLSPEEMIVPVLVWS